MSSSNSTGDITRVGWASNNCGRSTLNIIWSCLSTIFICTWTVFHPEVQPKSRKRWRTVWMIFGFCSPEGVTVTAFSFFMDVHNLNQIINENLKTKWTTEHSCLVVMKGWIAGTNCPSEGELLSIEAVAWLLNQGLVEMDQLPTREDILDKSKASPLVKALTCLQATWLVIQVIARAAERLPITTLEIATIAYVGCALMSYLFWWRAPQDVQQTIRLNCKPFSLLQSKIFESQSFDIMPEKSMVAYTVFLIPLIFGLLHCTAWNSNVFPSSLERDLWRVTSVLTIPLSLMTTLIMLGSPLQMPLLTKGSLSKIREVVFFVAGLVYLFVRLYLLAEPFVGLRSVPVAVYQDVQWVSFVPHI